MNRDQKSQNRRTAKQSEVMKEQMAKRAACKRQMKDHFKSIDYFGQQVSFTWNGEDQFKTTFGATISLILMIVLLGYGIDRLIKVIERDSPVVTTTTMIRDQTDDYPYAPYESGFDFAFGLTGTFDKSVAYFTVKQIFNNYNESNPPTYRTKKSHSLEFDACGSENFDYPDQEEVRKFGISNMNCITENDYYLQGNFYRSHMKYLEIKLWKCQNSTIDSAFPGENIICKNQTYIDSYLDNQQFSLAFINNLIDSGNFENPIQPYIDDSLFFELDSKVIKKANFFVQLSNASLSDSILPVFNSGGDVSFHQVKNIRTYEDNYSNNDGYLVAVYIRYDREYTIYTRTVSDLLQWLSDIGGLQGTLLGIGMVIVGFITSRMFMSKIVRKIYQIRKYENLQTKSLQNSKGNKIGVIEKDDVEKNSSNDLVIDPYSKDAPNLPSLTVTPSEQFKDTEDTLQQKFKTKTFIFENDVKNILYAFINRTRFKYTIQDILTYIIKCMCLRQVSNRRKSPQFKKHFLFQKAEEKFMKELDVVRIVKTLRKFKMFAQAMLSQKHRLILRFQRQNLVETSSSSSDSDDNSFDTVRLMEQDNPLIRLVMFGKLKKMMMQFKGKPVDNLERNMMRGLYIRKLKDFAEEQREIGENQTLLHRLLEGLKMADQERTAHIEDRISKKQSEGWQTNAQSHGNSEQHERKTDSRISMAILGNRPTFLEKDGKDMDLWNIQNNN